MGLDMLVGVLGILRTGTCYCPIDVIAWNPARILTALRAVGSTLLASTVARVDVVEQAGDYQLCAVSDFLDGGDDVLTGEMEELFTVRGQMRMEDLIYIIFTSGTTGNPKGVMVSHGSAAHLVCQDFPDAMRVRPSERVLLFFSSAFDGCALLHHLPRRHPRHGHAE